MRVSTLWMVGAIAALSGCHYTDVLVTVEGPDTLYDQLTVTEVSGGSRTPRSIPKTPHSFTLPTTFVATDLSSSAPVTFEVVALREGNPIASGVSAPVTIRSGKTVDVTVSLSRIVSLDLDLSEQLDSRLVFSRGSAATYFDPDGVLRSAAAGAPRFDHDPMTGEPRGLLVEEQRANVIASDSTESTVVSAMVFTSNVAIAPDGTTTMDRYAADGTNGAHQLYGALGTLPANASSSVSVFLKSEGHPYVNIAIRNQNASATDFVQACFNLDDPKVVVTNVGQEGLFTHAPELIELPNGIKWARLGAIASPTAPSTDIGRVFIGLLNGPCGSNPLWMNPGASILAWGFQIEQGDHPTSYIPKPAGLPMVRQADHVSLQDASSIEGDVSFAAQWFTHSATAEHDQTVFHIASLSNGDTVDYSRRTATGTSRFQLQSGGAIELDIGDNLTDWPPSTGSNHLAVATFDASGGTVIEDGIAATSRPGGITTPKALGTLDLAWNSVSAGSFLDGTIKRIRAFPGGLTASELTFLGAEFKISNVTADPPGVIWEGAVPASAKFDVTIYGADNQTVVCHAQTDAGATSFGFTDCSLANASTYYVEVNAIGVGDLVNPATNNRVRVRVP